jgi:hypothetical protein
VTIWLNEGETGQVISKKNRQHNGQKKKYKKTNSEAREIISLISLKQLYWSFLWTWNELQFVLTNTTMNYVTASCCQLWKNAYFYQIFYLLFNSEAREIISLISLKQLYWSFLRHLQWNYFMWNYKSYQIHYKRQLIHQWHIHFGHLKRR